MQKLKDIWTSWTDVGIHWPYLYDPTTDQPSITLGLLYLTSLVMLGSLIALHLKDGLLTATLTSIMVWILAYVMYRLRKLDNFKINLKEQSIELDGEDDENETK